jgi:hypothetical protein
LKNRRPTCSSCRPQWPADTVCRYFLLVHFVIGKCQ